MSKQSQSSLRPAPLASVRLTGGLLQERQAVVLRDSISYQYHQLKTTGRIDTLRLEWRPGAPNKPHEFWDSDIAKWIESASYGLTIKPDPELEARIDDVVELMRKAQEPSGYFNSFFQSVSPDKKFTNLRDQHELYCAGHLMEAAVAYFQATGKRALLDILCRYADHIAERFGPGKGQIKGYDGHPEVELGLARLAQATGNDKYMRLAGFFVDERGKGNGGIDKPGAKDSQHFFDLEAVARGDDPAKLWCKTYDYFQAHQPIRDQATIEGHSVRALYLFAGVADVAAATGDSALLAACRRVWNNMVSRRMYITGGVGSSRHCERFTYDFDLPNESSYAETCASIALAFFAQRMANLDRDGKYIDVLELALYNTCLAGISLDGRAYFYANYLATDPRWHDYECGFLAERHPWFGCACCPPNITRLLASIGSYAYSVGEGELAVNLYTASEVKAGPITLACETDYPWSGDVRLAVRSGGGKLALRLRIPGWAGKYTLRVNGKKVPAGLTPRKGYVTVSRVWKVGDVVELSLPMVPRRVYADVRVRHNTGRVCLLRGPVVYCLEEKDNGAHLNTLLLPRRSKLTDRREPKLLGGVVSVSAPAVRDTPARGKPPALYDTVPPTRAAAKVKFIPYYAWANRGRGEMTVWVREAP